MQIQLIDHDGQQAVYASDLHRSLDIGARLSTWIPRMIKYGFVENVDYHQLPRIVQLVQGGNNVVYDWILTLDMAKHIAMVQRSEKGKRIREYFIECEKQLRERTEMTRYSEDPIIGMRIKQIELEERVNLLEAKTTTRPEYFTVAGFARATQSQVSIKEAASIGRSAAKLCRERGYTIDTTPDARYGYVNMYPKEVLAELFGL